MTASPTTRMAAVLVVAAGVASLVIWLIASEQDWHYKRRSSQRGLSRSLSRYDGIANRSHSRHAGRAEFDTPLHGIRVVLMRKCYLASARNREHLCRSSVVSFRCFALLPPSSSAS